ncbi:hypothetical protein L6164_012509 [Bauhinia variegata]|uniref:Uncharacterized protein n=1 Tax=Bauhinia variegata TaxID=167791 RepID=A0ACB9PFG3_BAUVA|nr:hypothetical protein L6164_012509 [Bauhinia variegata]
MAPPKDLREIGLEGFALIDKFYGPQRRSSTTPPQQGRWLFQGPKPDEPGKPKPQYRWESYLLSLLRAAITKPSSFSFMHSPILFSSFGMEDHELQLVNVESPSEFQSPASPSIQPPSDLEIPDLEIKFGSYGTRSPILTSSSSSLDLNIELQNISVASTDSSPPLQLSSTSATATTKNFDYSLRPFYYRPYDLDLDISYYHYYQDYCWYYEQHCQFYSSFASTDSSPPPQLSSSSATVSDEQIVSVEGKFEDATKAVTEILENVFEDELEEEADSDDLILL